MCAARKTVAIGRIRAAASTLPLHSPAPSGACNRLLRCAALHFVSCCCSSMARRECAGGVGRRGDVGCAALCPPPPAAHRTVPLAGLRVCGQAGVHACMLTLSSSKCVRSTSFGLGGAGLLPAHRERRKEKEEEKNGGSRASVSNATHSPGQRTTQRTRIAHLSLCLPAPPAVRVTDRNNPWLVALLAVCGCCGCFVGLRVRGGRRSLSQLVGSGHNGRSRSMARTRAERGGREGTAASGTKRRKKREKERKEKGNSQRKSENRRGQMKSWRHDKNCYTHDNSRNRCQTNYHTRCFNPDLLGSSLLSQSSGAVLARETAVFEIMCLSSFHVWRNNHSADENTADMM